jgi:O-antigen/teichoic acid export membrane protein
MIAIQLASYKLASLGLILGNLVSHGISSYMFFKGLVLGNVKKSNLSVNTLFKLLRKHRNFPKFSAPASLFYSATQQTPLLIITAFSGTYHTGLFLLAERLLASPVNMVRESINQGIHKDLAEIENPAKMGAQALKFCLYLFKMVFPPAISCIAFLPLVIELVLGSDWKTTGVLMSVLLPFYAINLTFAPSLPIIPIMGWQKRGLIYQIFNFLVTSTTLIASLFLFDFILAIGLFMTSRLIMVTVNRLLIFRSLRVNISPFASVLIAYSIIYGVTACIVGNLSELTGPIAVAAYCYLAASSIYYISQLLKIIKDIAHDHPESTVLVNEK